MWSVRIGVGAVRLYQIFLSPFLGGHCRFHPSCSVYAIEAIETHGLWRGTRLAMARMGRCHPWGGQGYDPVPPPSSPSASMAAPTQEEEPTKER